MNEVYNIIKLMQRQANLHSILVEPFVDSGTKIAAAAYECKRKRKANANMPVVVRSE